MRVRMKDQRPFTFAGLWDVWLLIGLFRKLHHLFLALVDDARLLRSESFHHLKTLLEIYFYIKWVGAESTDDRAKLVLARTYNERIKLFNNSPRTAAMGKGDKHLAGTSHAT